MAASANFALKAGAWFRRGRLLIVSPDSLGTACPLSGRNSTYRPVQISGTTSDPGRSDLRSARAARVGGDGDDCISQPQKSHTCSSTQCLEPDQPEVSSLPTPRF